MPSLFIFTSLLRRRHAATSPSLVESVRSKHENAGVNMNCSKTNETCYSNPSNYGCNGG
jgi:hypothetical protein